MNTFEVKLKSEKTKENTGCNDLTGNTTCQKRVIVRHYMFRL